MFTLFFMLAQLTGAWPSDTVAINEEVFGTEELGMRSPFRSSLIVSQPEECTQSFYSDVYLGLGEQRENIVGDP